MKGYLLRLLSGIICFSLGVASSLVPLGRMVTSTTTLSSLQRTQADKSMPIQVRKEAQLNIPKDGWEPIFFEAINERAKVANLKTLRADALPESDIEVRVWHGFGLTALEGFGLKRAAGKWSAIHVEGIHPRLPLSEYQRTLQAPKSGWELCWRRLEEAGILMLPDAAAIGCSAMMFDGMSYVVEFNGKGTYRTYLYDNPSYAKCNEAKQMIKIGNIIFEEFGVSEMATNE
jgi:hypothetical protein